MVKTCISCKFREREHWGEGFYVDRCSHPDAHAGYDVVDGTDLGQFRCRHMREEHLKCVLRVGGGKRPLQNL